MHIFGVSLFFFFMGKTVLICKTKKSWELEKGPICSRKNVLADSTSGTKIGKNPSPKCTCATPSISHLCLTREIAERRLHVAAGKKIPLANAAVNLQQLGVQPFFFRRRGPFESEDHIFEPGTTNRVWHLSDIVPKRFELKTWKKKGERRRSNSRKGVRVPTVMCV